MRYNNYHKHSMYSNIKSLDVVCKPIEYINRAKELDGDKAIYFSTEHGYQGNVYEAHSLCKTNNIKLIVGSEVYYVPNRFEKDKSNYHLVMIAKNKEGYYESLVVTIGDGKGDNWWCVLFPPFCLIENDKKTDVEYRLYIKDMLEKYF